MVSTRKNIQTHAYASIQQMVAMASMLNNHVIVHNVSTYEAIIELLLHNNRMLEMIIFTAATVHFNYYREENVKLKCCGSHLKESTHFIKAV